MDNCKLKIDYGSINDQSFLFNLVEKELVDEYYEDEELTSKLRDVLYTYENEKVITQLYLEEFFKWLNVEVKSYEFVMTNQYDFQYVVLTKEQIDKIYLKYNIKEDKIEDWFKEILSIGCDFKIEGDTWFQHFIYEVPFNEVLLNDESDYLEEYFKLIKDKVL